MSTYEQNQATQEPQKNIISLNTTEEIAYWVKRFKCRVEELKEAVRAVGNSIISVDDFLSSR